MIGVPGNACRSARSALTRRTNPNPQAPPWARLTAAPYTATGPGSITMDASTSHCPNPSCTYLVRAQGCVFWGEGEARRRCCSHLAVSCAALGAAALMTAGLPIQRAKPCCPFQTPAPPQWTVSCPGLPTVTKSTALASVSVGQGSGDIDLNTPGLPASFRCVGRGPGTMPAPPNRPPPQLTEPTLSRPLDSCSATFRVTDSANVHDEASTTLSSECNPRILVSQGAHCDNALAHLLCACFLC